MVGAGASTLDQELPSTLKVGYFLKGAPQAGLVCKSLIHMFSSECSCASWCAKDLDSTGVPRLLAEAGHAAWALATTVLHARLAFVELDPCN